VRGVFEREREKAPEILTREVVEGLIAIWTEGFKCMFLKTGVANPDEVAQHGPPEPMPPWRGGF
jgi:hypothetical protein